MYIYLFIVVLIGLVYYLWNQKVGVKVYWFHSPNCPHCTEMEDEWNDVEKKLCGSGIVAKRIDTSDPKYNKLKKNFKVTGVPSIIKVKPNGIRVKYDGNRKTENIIEWIYEDDNDL